MVTHHWEMVLQLGNIWWVVGMCSKQRLVWWLMARGMKALAAGRRSCRWWEPAGSWSKSSSCSCSCSWSWSYSWSCSKSYSWKWIGSWWLVMIRHCRRQLGLTEKGGYLRADQLFDRSNAFWREESGFQVGFTFQCKSLGGGILLLEDYSKEKDLWSSAGEEWLESTFGRPLQQLLTS